MKRASVWLVLGMGGLCIPLCIALAGQAGQYPAGRYPSGQRTPRGGRQAKANPQKDKPAEDVLPTFAGTVRSVAPKRLTLDVQGENTLDLECSRKTRYYDGSKKIDAGKLKVGDAVTVEAKWTPARTLEAVTVHREAVQPASQN